MLEENNLDQDLGYVTDQEEILEDNSDLELNIADGDNESLDDVPELGYDGDWEIDSNSGEEFADETESESNISESDNESLADIEELESDTDSGIYSVNNNELNEELLANDYENQMNW